MKNANEFANLSKTEKIKTKRKKILIIALATVVLLPAVILAAGLLTFEIWSSTVDISPDLLPTAASLPTFYDSDGIKIDTNDDAYLSKDELFDDLVNAFVAVEDKRFFKHKGYDAVRIGGAIVSNVKQGAAKEGASTITQQLIKNTHLTSERTLKRKLKEVALARKLEKMYSKEDILSMYLSVIYFGSGAYGVKSAARTFFDKNVQDLTLEECATLAGIVKNPAGYSPLYKSENCLKRRNLALSLMREQGYIDDSQYEKATSAPLNVKSADKKTGNLTAYLALAKEEAANMLGMSKYQFDNSGAKVYLNLVSSLQNSLEAERSNADNFESGDVSSATAVVDNSTGCVLAYCSNLPYAVTRQTGSVLKPLAVYAPALDTHAVSLATPIVDEKIDFNGFSPSNFNDAYYGETTVREGIKKSMNSVSVKVLDYLGLENSVNYLEKFGISVQENDKNYSLALGSCSSSPVAIAGAYSALARGGKYVKPSFVNYVVVDDKKVATRDETQTIVTKEASAYLMTLALKDAVKDGTAKSLSTLPFDLAAKTGTVEREGKNSDAWCASYCPEYTVVVWHGSDDGMTERGGGYPTRHAKAVWKVLQQQNQISMAFAPCDDVKCVEIDDYSTRKNKRVVAATQNTPLEYRKFEFFDSSALPLASDSSFDRVEQKRLDVKLFEGHIELTFEQESIYRYKLYRTDVLGRALIYVADGDDSRQTLRDTPISFGRPIEYELIVELKNNSALFSSSKKSVYFEVGNAF